jgi:hypothetical protein
MPYITPSDLRNEGVTTEEYTNEYIVGRIALAQEFIEKVTGRFFEKRIFTQIVSGRGHDTLILPHPPISATAISEVKISDEVLEADYYSYYMRRYPSMDDRFSPKIRKLGGIWPKGTDNISVTGSWGFVEDDSGLVAPPLIKRLCILIVVKELPEASSASGSRSSDIIEEQLGDYRYKLAETATQRGGLFGDAKIDSLLSMFRQFRSTAL